MQSEEFLNATKNEFVLEDCVAVLYDTFDKLIIYLRLNTKKGCEVKSLPIFIFYIILFAHDIFYNLETCHYHFKKCLDYWTNFVILRSVIIILRSVWTTEQIL